MKPENLILKGQDLSINEVIEVAFKNRMVEPSSNLLFEMDAGFMRLNDIVNRGEKIYGLTTGFGSLAEKSITLDEVNNLQRGLIISHAQGIGKPFPSEVVRAMLLLRSQTLARNYSGVRGNLIKYLTTFLNNNYLPIVPSQGSVGASGDLIPLAHLALPLIGLGKVAHNSRIISGGEALAELNLKPYSLELREGLALINGTQAMLAMLIYLFHHSQKLLYLYNLTSAMTLEALRATDSFLTEDVYKLRPYAGIESVINHLKKLLEDSLLINPQPPHRVQEAYSLRCIPQVHGTAENALILARNMVEIEINAVTDNPILTENGVIISQGNFHGAPLAWMLDALAIALVPLGAMSERRIYKLLSGSYEKDLPSYLSSKPGVQSGLMILQYQAASLVNMNKVLSHPASVDTIPTAQGQEDHVSMGMNAALKLQKIVDNLYYIVVIELITAYRALSFYGQCRLGQGAKWFAHNYGNMLSISDEDLSYSEEMENLKTDLSKADLKI